MAKQGKLSRSEAAAALGVTPKTLYMWERRGRIPAPERDWRNWRWYTLEQLQQIRAELLGLQTEKEPVLPLALELSTRNRLACTVKRIEQDRSQAEVTLVLEGGQEMVALLSSSAVRRMGLHVGAKAVAFIRETDVLVGV